MNIEPLESRIAPASLTFADLDGDKVTITTSGAGVLTLGGNVLVSGSIIGIDLTVGATGFQGASVSIVATRDPVAGGDGLVNVGYIKADGFDLGAVMVDGDLGMITCGDSTTDTGFGLKSLSVLSLGRFAGATGGSANADGTFESHITGALGAVTIKGDLSGAWLNVTGNAAADAKIGAVTIGGSIIGGATFHAGAIESSGDIGVVKIGRDIQGGPGLSAGFVQSDSGTIKSVTLGGSLIGGGGANSGQIQSLGDIGAVKIGGDLHGGAGNESGKIDAGAGVTVAGPATGKIASVTIGGSITGSSGNYDTFIDGNSIVHFGQIFSAGKLGVVKIGHDLQGGAGRNSGAIESAGEMTGVTIGGSLVGGPATNSGSIHSEGKMGAVKIGRDLQGAAGTRSGRISSGDDMASVTIGGSVVGGSGFGSGEIDCHDDLGAVKIGLDLIGASISGTAPALEGSGYIVSGGYLTSVTIGGSVISGIDASTGGDLTKNASIRAAYGITSLTVKGSLIGHPDSGKGASPVIITAGSAVDLPDNLVLDKISIGGRVEFASILAGYNAQDLTASNGNAQIGAVKIGGDWIASNLVAGVEDTGAAGFGDAGDTIPNGGTTAKIASIVIGGQVVGTPGGDRFGFVSHTIGSFKSRGFTAPLTATAGQFFQLAPATGDVTIREI